MSHTRLIRLPVVVERTGRSRSRIYVDVAAGTFPAPVKIGRTAIAWPEHEIDRWIEERIDARDAERAPQAQAEADS